MKKEETDKVLVYLRNKTINPSGYYRIYQYTSNIKNCDFTYRELVPDKIYYTYHFNNNFYNKIRYIVCIFIRSIYYLGIDSLKRDWTVIINREICPRKCLLLQRMFLIQMCKKNRIIWDIDDDILAGREISQVEWDIIQEHSHSIIVSSPYLSKLIKEKDRKKISLLNTTDGDFQYTKSLLDNRVISMKNTLKLVWIATSSNIMSLKYVLVELDEFAMKLKKKSGSQVILCCVCNKSVLEKVNYLKIENVEWSRKKALLALQEAHIGIMPLIDNEFSRGKGGFKLIQYMAAGLPVVASPVGINNEIVKDNVGKLPRMGEWSNAIDSICSSAETWKEYSENSRKEWENNYSYEKTLESWMEWLKR